MIKRIAPISLTLISLAITPALLTACASKPAIPKPPKINTANASFWQRADVRETTYLNGITAQKTLNRDIAQCVAAVKQAATMNTLRRAIPADTDPNEPYDIRNLKDWDSPNRQRYLHAEHNNFQSFEQCMKTKGWMRVHNLPHEEVKRAEGIYIDHQSMIQIPEGETFR